MAGENDVVEKPCSVCHEVKPLDAFFRKSAARFGRTSRCKTCWHAATPGPPKACNFCEKTMPNRRRNFHPECIEPARARAEKRCAKCDVVKPIGEFNRQASYSDGWHKHCRPCGSEVAMAWQDNNLDTVLNSHLTRKFGITLGEFRTMEAAQGGVCAICQQPPPDPQPYVRGTKQRRQGRAVSTRLVVDHNHQTGKVRGLLCSACNKGIGLLGDDAKRVAAALAYLEEADS